MKKILVILAMVFSYSCSTAFHQTEVIIKATPPANNAVEPSKGKEKNTEEPAAEETASAETSVQETTPVESEPAQGPTPARYVSLGFGIYEYSEAIEPSCGQNVNKIIFKRDWLDFTIHWFLGGIYSARSIYIHCN